MSAKSKMQFINQSFEMTRAFGLAVIDNPALLDEIPSGATIVFLPDDDAAYTEHSIELGIAAIRRGENVYFKHIRDNAASLKS